MLLNTKRDQSLSLRLLLKKVNIFLLYSNKLINPKDIKSNTVCLVQINSIISDTSKEKECIVVEFRERNNANEIHQSTRIRVTQYVRKDASLLYPGEGITPVNLLVD